VLCGKGIASNSYLRELIASVVKAKTEDEGSMNDEGHAIFWMKRTRPASTPKPV